MPRPLESLRKIAAVVAGLILLAAILRKPGTPRKQIRFVVYDDSQREVFKLLSGISGGIGGANVPGASPITPNSLLY
jgi:hypothetical protein